VRHRKRKPRAREWWNLDFEGDWLWREKGTSSVQSEQFCTDLEKCPDQFGQRRGRSKLNCLAGQLIRSSVIISTIMTICSPYLSQPLRTLRQACRDVSASHPELIPPGFDVHAGAEQGVAYDYSLAIKNRGRPPKPWRWEIYTAGKSKPVRQSEFFETMSEATRTGKVALAGLRANRAA